MARESTIQILYGGTTTGAPTDLSDGEFAYAHASKNLFIGAGGDNTVVWLGAEILDEDAFTSNSDTSLATQQSIKAYVDGVVAASSAGVSSVEGLSGDINLIAGTGLGVFTGGAESQDITIAGVTASTSAIGVASFSSDNFAVSAGGEVTVKDGGIANAELVNSSITLNAGDGLATTGTSIALGAGATLSVNVDNTTIEIATDALQVKALGIDTAQLAADAVDGTKIADDSIDSEHYVDGSVDNIHLANSTITFAGPSTSTAISLGGSVGITGTVNEVNVAESSGTFTIGLPDDVTIAGNLTVNGTVTTIDTTNLVVEDPLIKLASNNNTTDSVDIGFYGLYDTSGSQDLFAGLFRDANDSGKFKLFETLQSEPTTTVNTGGTGYAVATLVANISGGSFS